MDTCHFFPDVDKAKNAAVEVNRQYRSVLVYRKVPLEIWEMIFSQLCLSLHKHSKFYSTHLGFPAILVSQVCSQWRVIAKGLSSIWSFICVNLDMTSYNILAPLQLYLLNSKESPLKIRIEGAGKANLSPQGLDAWRMLSRHMYRSREFVMESYIARPNGVPPIHDLTFPNLEFFYEGIIAPSPHKWPWFWRAIREAPKLTKVCSLTLNPVLAFPSVTTWNVLRLETSDDANNFLHIVKSCRHLESLTLLECFPRSEVGLPDHGVIELPSLRQLSVRAHSQEASCLSIILESLVMPSLETCDIQYEVWNLPSDGFLSMFRRSSTSLKQLTFTITGSSALRHLPLFNLLQETSELTHLELSLSASGYGVRRRIESLLSTLFLKLGGHAFLPKLKLLSFKVPHHTMLTVQVVEAVLGIVSARQTTPYPLTDFRLVRLDGEREFGVRFVVTPPMLARIRVLKESGIKVVIEDRSKP